METSLEVYLSSETDKLLKLLDGNKLARIGKEKEQARKLRIMELHQQGFDHAYIAQELGMRPQNVLSWLRRNTALVATGTQSLDIVSPDQQREVLEKTYDELTDDIQKMDELIEFHYNRYNELMKSDNEEIKILESREGNFGKLTKLLTMKNVCITSIIQHWGIPESITKSAKASPSSLSANNMQVNFEHITEQKINPDKVSRLTKEIKEVMDEKMFGNINGTNGKD